MDKKGDISMNMIIMAIIALLVLAIIAYLIFTQTSRVEEGSLCENINGQCQSGTSCTGDYPIRTTAGICQEEGQICCVQLGQG